MVAPATCQACGARIRWVRSEHDNLIPIDPDPVDDGNVVLVDRAGKTVAVRQPHGTFVTHYATCPAAQIGRAQ